MARTRIKEAPVYKTWEEVDAALKEIAEAELDLVDIEGEMNKQIQGIKLTAAQEAKPIQDRIAAIGKDIKAFVEEHRGELDGKTKTLNFGKTGFRMSTKVILPKAKEKLAAIIKSLKSRKMNDCIVVTETINKDILKKYTEDEILRVGASLKKEDTFWYETDREKLQALQR
ncbi:prophage MuMc02, host-nuclease inhibitor protein [Syntrophobotulus glycolicus DSM 8271]|uniref:Prophage MuMc02, host-nuclease inhibitor protein n=1 Tax=Syntrophobotulus glycolicus (strain DSM 8271 / FlGlyR) TaxID=645991 RepID=F0SX51_SYNGF|nr:host-nuclease inhibitor Gam family protein [Syntrophobotulus glycolicus]ADY54891.1 prophage MuMc02, host-nuclease inhibitor protein [Syntrophobotulus glycolicus DSM 8271]ADY56911.1 prophage MuMc02, host-nuclease inhibitor protein [Syntrophobotulus glycolicus DSM 8271]ADY57248.1 prophage MuMc02, host-nuclease inhibitor protein [Syntrophobotulus glycolicus DSM 8271]ADY57420.1 prophage MuMc02, host-nuclease inhibitor protein [Syntrophobotulus glycolicus DSM 8271]